MERLNGSSPTFFILLPITNILWLQKILFFLVFIFYLLTIMSNLAILSLVIKDINLHSPMYFFLASLSLVDIGISSTTVPKMMVGLWVQNNISLKGCFTQIFFFHVFAGTEGITIAVMGLDRYIAICHPLRYVTIMRKATCIQLVLGSWSVCLSIMSMHVAMLSALPFCDGYIVKNFFCDFKPVIKLACTDTHFNEVFLAAFTGISAILAFVMLILSYCFILKHLLKIRSSEGRSKAFSTCSSHFIIVMLYYGATICIYIRPASESSIEKDRVATIIFTVITPALNPIIYTLRNKDIKKSLRQLVLRANTQRVAVQ
ncbi:olfactory receptor 1G1-like [Leptodactylus fuscus]|uniref:olfactory receptor 1G1-like n=1 Tax=Leptodactylus fuscus TaxID=238119 RepID=UPI003F4F1B99